MKYLGIESSCDETAAAVVDVTDGKMTVLSNVVASQIETHRLFGGVVPEIASRAHCEAISSVVAEALTAANLKPADLTAIGVTTHPGLIGALLVGVNFAKALAFSSSVPLVPVDHIKAHLSAVYLSPTPPTPPYLALAVSGGHTCLFEAKSETSLCRIGSTRDDAIGEAFDKVGRLIGIPYPAGAGFDRLAQEGFAALTGISDPADAYRAFLKNETALSGDYRLPSPALQDGTLDFSFSGLKTAAVNLLHHAEEKKEEIDRPRFAAVYTARVVEAVCKQVKEALSRYRGYSLVVAGGVAANSHLRRRLGEVANAASVSLYVPPLSLCGDNGAMVAAATHFAFSAGVRADETLNASAQDED